MMFKFVSDFFFLLFLLFVLLSPLFLLVGAFLIWKGGGIVRVLGWLLLLLVTYYRLHWISPWCVVQGSKLVQEFNLNELDGVLCSSIRSPRWVNTANSLLFVPDERVFFPEYKKVFVVDLKARQTYWQPMIEVNLDEVRCLESLRTGYTEQRDGLSLYYALPSKLGPRAEFSVVGFSLPILGYRFPFPVGGSYGWEWGKTYFSWERLLVRESESGPVVVELNKIVFNDDERRHFYKGASAWVMEGKFLIVEANHRVLVLGSFNTSQHT